MLTVQNFLLMSIICQKKYGIIFWEQILWITRSAKYGIIFCEQMSWITRSTKWVRRAKCTWSCYLYLPVFTNFRLYLFHFSCITVVVISLYLSLPVFYLFCHLLKHLPTLNTVTGSQRQCFTSPLWRRGAERSFPRYHSPSNQKLAVFSTGISGAFLIAELVRIDMTHQMFCLLLV